MQNCVVQWLEDTARKFPERRAFVDEKRCHTWAELRQTALSIAANIEHVLSGQRHPVAVYMEKSADMLAVYTGIAYSGNFYSPIAANMPANRIEKMVQTLQPALLITTQELKSNVGGAERKSISPEIYFALRILSTTRWMIRR